MRGLGLAIGVVTCVDAACRYGEGQAERERRVEGGSGQARRLGKRGGKRLRPNGPVVSVCSETWGAGMACHEVRQDVSLGAGWPSTAMAWFVSRRRVGSLREGKSLCAGERLSVPGAQYIPISRNGVVALIDFSRIRFGRQGKSARGGQAQWNVDCRIGKDGEDTARWEAARRQDAE